MVPLIVGTKILISPLNYFHKISLVKNTYIFLSLKLRSMEVYEDQWLAMTLGNYEKTVLSL